jgi:hypothetical protein
MKLFKIIKQFFCSHPIDAHHMMLISKQGIIKYYDIECVNCSKVIYQNISNIDYDDYIKAMRQE